MQEKGLDFRFLISRKIDPPLRSVAVREARAKRATTACCGGKFFFWGVISGVSLIRVQGPDFFKTKKKICTPSKICVGKKKFAPNTGWV